MKARRDEHTEGHYKLVEEARRQEFFQLREFRNDSITAPHLDLAETLQMGILQSFRPYIQYLAGNIAHGTRGPRGMHFVKICNEVFEATEWTGLTEAYKEEDIEGLNVSMPLFESGRQTYLKKVYYHFPNFDLMDVFVTPPFKLPGKLFHVGSNQTHTSQDENMTQDQKNRVNNAIELAFALKRIPLRTLVYLTFEITNSGQRHRIPYSSMQDVGLFRDHDDLFTLGIALVWQDPKGGWKRSPVVQGRNNDLHSHRGAYSGYVQPMALIHGLHR
jgi:hypothetical protein